MRKSRFRMRSLILFIGLCLLLMTAAFAGDSEGAKEAILQGLEERETTILLEKYGLDRDEVWPLFTQVLNENPRLFYVRNGGGQIWFYGNTVTRMEIQYVNDIGDAEIAAYEAAVAEALSCILPGMSDLQKALVLHDWLVLHKAYDYDNYLAGTLPEISYSAYGVMVLGTGVCEGYARAYADLLQRCGIPCITVNSTSMNHTWNQVCLDGSWYHVDVTWDDPTPDLPGRVLHTHFLHSDGWVQEPTDNVSAHNGWANGRNCTDTRYDSGAFWQQINGPVIFTDEDTFWQLRAAGQYTSQTVSLICRSFSTGKETTAAQVKDYWPVWKEWSYWLDAYSGLGMMDGCLYFNDTLHIYCYDPKTGSLTTAETISGEDGYIYGLYAGEKEIRYRIATHPQDTGTERILPSVIPERYPEAAPESPFQDIPAGALCYDAAVWALETGVTKGTGTDKASGKVIFDPDGSCTRGQVVTFLWRAMGCPEPKSTVNPFVDVTEQDYFYKPVLWAVEQNITNGMLLGGQSCFCPDMPCSYAHILTFLWRCVTGGVTDSTNWYEKPVAWAKQNELLSGVDITDSPADYQCPRDAVVLFLHRCAA